MRTFDEADKLYDDIDALEPDTETYRPKDLPEREDELDELHSALEPIARGGTPRDVLIYGPTGQGKTHGVKLKTDQLQEWADRNDVDLTTVNVQCKGSDKSYNVLTLLVKQLREVRFGPGVDKPVGHQRKTLVEMAFEEMEEIGGTILVVLDEIDAIGEDDYILYELPRANLDDAKLGVIGITNDLQFRDNLDADVRSSLGKREITFHPYDANQLKNILARRAVKALRDTEFEGSEEKFTALESGVLKDDVIPLCAAFAAQDTGDARQGLRLLSRSVELSKKENDEIVTESHVRKAKAGIERDRVGQSIRAETTQRKLALLTVVEAAENGETPAETSDLYEKYSDYCEAIDADNYIDHTFREKLNDLEHSGLLEKNRTGRGHGKGMTNTYDLQVSTETAFENLSADGRLSKLVENIRSDRRQSTL